MAQFDCRAFMASVRREAGERRFPQMDMYTLRALLRLSGVDFLAAAYRALLGRDVDPDGVRGYLPKASHMSGRVRILVALLFSPEQTWMPSTVRRALARVRELRHGGRPCGQ